MSNIWDACPEHMGHWSRFQVEQDKFPQKDSEGWCPGTGDSVQFAANNWETGAVLQSSMNNCQSNSSKCRSCSACETRQEKWTYTGLKWPWGGILPNLMVELVKDWVTFPMQVLESSNVFSFFCCPSSFADQAPSPLSFTRLAKVYHSDTWNMIKNAAY